MSVAESLEAEVVVVGGGPAGIAAAAVAAEGGASVLLLDENPALGGQIWRRDTRGDVSRQAERWLGRLERSGARVALGVSVADAARESQGAGFELLTVRGHAARWVRAGAVVLCTGARERFLPFPGWTLPGVVGVGGVQALIKSGMDVRGRRVVLAGSGPLLLAAAAGVARAGGRVRLVAEQAPRRRVARYAAGLWRTPSLLVQAAAYRGSVWPVRYALGAWITRAEGNEHVERVAITDGRREVVMPCDLLCTGYGLVPETRLAALLGCELDRDAVRVDAGQQTSVRGVFAAGEPTGIAGVDAAIVEGEAAGASSGRRTDIPPRGGRLRHAHRAAAGRMQRAFVLRDELRAAATPETIICRCEDVPIGQLDLAAGFRVARLHHRVGMGACQGRICGDALAWLAGWTPEGVRPPVVPIPLCALGAASSGDALTSAP